MHPIPSLSLTCLGPLALLALVALEACGGSPDHGPSSATGADTPESLLAAQPLTLSTSMILFDDSPLGVAVCGSGQGLSSGAPLYVAFENVPTVGSLWQGPFGTVNADTSFRFGDDQMALVADCPADTLGSDVTVLVYTKQDEGSDAPTPIAAGEAFAMATLPAVILCANGTPSVRFNGGCSPTP